MPKDCHGSNATESLKRVNNAYSSDMSGDPTNASLRPAEAWFDSPPKTDTTHRVGMIGIPIPGRNNLQYS